MSTIIGQGIGIPFSRVLGGIDPDAQAFITAAGITDPTQINAINRLVLNYKGVGNLNTSVDLWSASNAIYPMVGGSATNHMYNLKDPRNLDAAFRLTFSGGWTHNTNGITGNGTNTFANTFLNPTSILSSTNGRLGLYIRNNVSESRYDIGSLSGVNDIGFFSRSGGGNLITTYGLAAGGASIANTDSRGFYLLNRASSTNTRMFKNNLKVLDFAQTSGVTNQNIFIGASNSGTPSASASKNYAFSVIGQGLSDANALLEYDIIQQFQTDLNRQV